MSAPVLHAQQVSIRFGGLQALGNFELALHPRELVGIIGPNGAGKTTAFNLLTGIYRPTTGRVAVQGRTVTGRRPHVFARQGVARTFQNIRLFKDLSVLDNVRIGSHHLREGSWIRALLRTKRGVEEERAIQREAESQLELLGLWERRNELARNLSYGDQRRVEIARALATRPRCLLLDEPAAGMGAGEKVELMETIRLIREQTGVAILLIEHDMKLVMGTCERLLVLDHGVCIAEGEPEAVRRDPKVIEAYLGSGAAPAEEARRWK